MNNNSENICHIEITVSQDNEKEEDTDDFRSRVNDGERELRKWLFNSPISFLKFHAIEGGVCAYHNVFIEYKEALETYIFLKDHKSIRDIERKYNIKIDVSKPWNNQNKPVWFNGTPDDWEFKF